MPKYRKIVKMKLVPEKIYESIQDAAIDNDVDTSTISNRIREKTIVDQFLFTHYFDSKTDEIWKDHPTLGILVSNHGRVQYKNRRISNTTSKRYEKVSIGGKCHMIHRLVAETFIPNPHNKPIVHHIDHCKTNNHVDNLMWVTHHENIQFYIEYKNNLP